MKFGMDIGRMILVYVEIMVVLFILEVLIIFEGIVVV